MAEKTKSVLVLLQIKGLKGGLGNWLFGLKLNSERKKASNEDSAMRGFSAVDTRRTRLRQNALPLCPLPKGNSSFFPRVTELPIQRHPDHRDTPGYRVCT